MTEVFDAADAVPIGASHLANVVPEQWAALRFEFHPSVRRLDLFWNVPQTWKALTGDTERPQTSVRSTPEPWVLWRESLQTFFRSLAISEAEALDAARRGASFGELCACLAQHFNESEIPLRAAGYLRQWVDSGLITEVK